MLILRNLRKFKSVACLLENQKTYKNFGHKRTPVPTITVLWHGFLTFTLIGLALEWKRIGRYIYGEDVEYEDSTWDVDTERNE